MLNSISSTSALRSNVSGACISQRALFERVRRALASQFGLALRRCNSRSRGYWDLGDFYAIDVTTSFLSEAHIDLESRARELGVLQEHEIVAA